MLFFGLLPGPVVEAEGRELSQSNRFAGSKRGETHSKSGRRFCHEAKVYQTQRRAGFPGPIGGLHNRAVRRARDDRLRRDHRGLLEALTYRSVMKTLWEYVGC